MSVESGASRDQRRADFVRNFDRIIEGATLALASDPDASMNEIAQASGVARATLYRHFDNRHDLLREIYSSGLDAAAEAIDAAEPKRGDAPAALGRIIDALLVISDRYRIIAEQGLEYPELEPRAEEAIAPVGELIERGQLERTIRSDLPIRWLTLSVLNLTVSAIRAIGRGEIKADEAAEIVGRTFLQAVEVERAGI
jgi:TetR/AcrR family transcriptional regulator, mexCD-oprJ operon repressor